MSKVSNQTLLGRAFRLPLRLIPDSTVVRILRGPLRGAKWIVGSTNNGCWLGTFERDKQLAFRNVLEPTQIVYDVGAHVGLYTLLASSGVGASGVVYSFEPLPRNLTYLRKHIDLNNIRNCKIIDAAVAASDGLGDFDASRPPAMGWLSESGNLKVKIVSIDSLVASGQILPPHVMKIDVEGGELAVLTGAAKTINERRPTIFLATHGPQVHQDCLRFLRRCNYGLESLSDEGLDSTEELVACPKGHY